MPSSATMPPKKNSSKVATPSPSTIKPSFVSAPATEPTSLIPLQHYLSRVPLQLAALFFSLYPSSNRSLTPTNPINRVLKSLILDPTGFLSKSVLGIIVVQIWFGIWIRGLLNTSASTTTTTNKGEEGKREKKKGFSKMFTEALGGVKPSRSGTAAKKATKGKAGLGLESLVSALTTTLLGAFVLHLIAILLGASLISKPSETFHLSLLVSTLVVLPIAITFGPPNPNEPQFYIWLRLFSSLTPQNDLELALISPSIGALFGTWCGALPIPLDWDRDWQKWPTTCVIGALIGYSIGSLVGLGLVSSGYPGKSSRRNIKDKSL